MAEDLMKALRESLERAKAMRAEHTDPAPDTVDGAPDPMVVVLAAAWRECADHGWITKADIERVARTVAPIIAAQAIASVEPRCSCNPWPPGEQFPEHCEVHAERAQVATLTAERDAARKAAKEAIDHALGLANAQLAVIDARDKALADLAERTRERDALATEADELRTVMPLLRAEVVRIGRERDAMERNWRDALGLVVAASALLALKQGPRDAAYEAAKPAAWRALTEAVERYQHPTPDPARLVRDTRAAHPDADLGDIGAAYEQPATGGVIKEGTPFGLHMVETSTMPQGQAMLVDWRGVREAIAEGRDPAAHAALIVMKPDTPASPSQQPEPDAPTFAREPGCTCFDDDMDDQMLFTNPDCPLHGTSAPLSAPEPADQPDTGAQGTDEERHPEAYCHRCGGPNVNWSAPSPLWNQVMRGGDINGPWEFDEIICPVCFAQLAEERGVASFWYLSARRVHVPLQLVTPSGRVWDEDQCLWVHPAPATTETGALDAAIEAADLAYEDVLIPEWARVLYKIGKDAHADASLIPDPAGSQDETGEGERA